MKTELFSLEETQKYLAQTLPLWKINDNGHLYRSFHFHNFQEAIAFANQVGALAEEQGHHPELSLGWGFCRVAIWTHQPLGITQKDFRLAQAIEAYTVRAQPQEMIKT